MRRSLLPRARRGASILTRDVQVYPASFKDDNGDGLGDLRGLINKLPYLKSLGIDTIWLSPHYKSPRVDEGYDISDYQDIHEPFGNMDDCQELIDKVHSHGLKILFDLVVNHCSDQHDWFKESRSSKTNPKRDWFHWRPAKYDADGGELLRPVFLSGHSRPVLRVVTDALALVSQSVTRRTTGARASAEVFG